MALNKFERHIKKQLKEREIKPSADAWRRITEQMDVVEDQKANNFYRYGVAAACIGALFFSIWYFKMNESTLDEQKVVEETVIEVEENKGNTERVHETKMAEDNTVVHEEAKPKRTVTLIPSIKLNESQATIAIVKKNDKPIEKVGVSANEPDKLIDIKIAEIVAQVDLLEKNNTWVTDAEVNQLLRQAQEEILATKVLRYDNSVDATALLADVEGELDKSFRDQIFDALKDGFVKVRTAVADRNK